jgi:hypothetical protein
LFLILGFWTSRTLLVGALIDSFAQYGQTRSIELKTKQKLTTLTKLLQFQTQSYGAIITLETLSDAEVLADMGELVLRVESQLAENSRLTAQMVGSTLGIGSGDTAQIVQELDSKAQTLYQNLSLVEASMGQFLELVSQQHEELAEEYKNNLTQLKKMLSVQQQLQPILKQLVGVESRKTYAVVFQNEQELRPTGGFLQAVGLFTFEKGGLINFQTVGVTEIDKQLSGTVAPPQEITEILGEKNWFLRDSNWDPHFPSSASRIAWFIEQGLGTHVDGVLAINGHVLTKILEVVGPVELPEFSEVITHKNLLERLEFHSEAILVATPGSRDYSSTLFNSIFKKTLNLGVDKLPAVLTTIYDQLLENQALFSASDTDVKQVLASLGWDGSIATPECPTKLALEECVVSTVFQTEANVGVNKANHYLQRKISHQVFFEPKIARHVRKITYNNTSTSNSWPKGTYKTYLRLHLDSTAQLQKVTIGDREIPRSQLNLYQDHNKQVVGVVLSVPIMESRDVEIVYLTPLPDLKKFSFVLFNQEQPGMTNTSYEFEFLVGSLSPTLIAPTAKIINQNIVFDKPKAGNKVFGVTF